MQDRFKFRIPMFTDKGTFMEFQYIELGDFIECTLCGTNGEPQQCTGLKDKNGKLIYEGDILNYSCLAGYSDIYTCTFNNGSFLIGGLLISNTHLKSEVIGNIYENPKLLEAE